MGHIFFKKLFFNVIEKSNCNRVSFVSVCMPIHTQKRVLSQGVNVFFIVGCGQKATDPDDPEGLSKLSKCPAFPPEPDFAPMEPDWFLHLLPH